MLSELTLKQVVGFCILMEGGEGIVGKAPKYIDEKMRYMQQSNEQGIRNQLDLDNQRKYDQWMVLYHKYQPYQKSAGCIKSREERINDNMGI